MTPEDAPPCDAYRPTSPEAPACAWCARFRINLDAAGRLCVRCQKDARFRDALARHAAVRFGPDCPGGRTWCGRFETATTPGLCERCRADAAFRAFLHGQALARRSGRAAPRPPEADALPPCAARGGRLRTETRRCCGGRTREVPVHACARRGAADAADCRTCAERVQPDARAS